MKDEIKAGFIIVTSILLLSGFVVLIGESRLFEKLDDYYTEVTNAAGLETGAQVRLGGVRVGRVLSIREPTKPGEPVTIAIGIRKGTVLYKGTRAVITQIGFVGDIYLLLAIDKTTDERITVGGKIPAEEAVEFGRLMAKLDMISGSVDTLIKDVGSLFTPENRKKIETVLGNTNTALVSGTASVERIASALNSTTDKIEVVLNEVEGLVRDNRPEVKSLVKKAREDLEKAEHMIAAIERTAQSVDRTSETIGKAVDLQSRNLDLLLNTLTRTTEDLQDVLQDIRSKPWTIIYRE